MLAQACRRAVARPVNLVQKRCLGDAVKGADAFDIGGQWYLFKQFLTNPAITYTEYKAQCCAARLFIYAGVSASLTISLILDPPRSSYWLRWSPLSWPSRIKDVFMKPAGSVFLSDKPEGATNVPDLYSQLTLNRRLAGGSSDSDEEH
eukprot:gnl/MRDRNA2_/MRDRNA2_92755_c0_seq1.p1 gnl/MRDRNA2_/MRDRNA2_92755_c0~~gnl/MRDRNA2_/MRDRNA2_92755_c0_seq1.p1  ORF type:complete len:148 (-),score=19.83 gnl/MRDRNA2_/MRDRNA2_92755_c0_seq1:91-534(-)